ncbi:MAG: carboxypeptidase-like regulatory domain-containing protein [candidate division Zixibacteria bacterium]|nr:carboxypeptidase-like regulatory domain-containing protein [candidate division Zixibacteria bacterium]
MFLTKVFARLLFVGAALALYGSCQRESVDSVSTVRGTVTDSLTGVPLAGAEIFLRDTLMGELMYVTDSTGDYDVGSFGVAQWTIYCRADGYRTKSRYVQGEGTIENVDFEMAQ